MTTVTRGNTSMARKRKLPKCDRCGVGPTQSTAEYRPQDTPEHERGA